MEFRDKWGIKVIRFVFIYFYVVHGFWYYSKNNPLDGSFDEKQYEYLAMGCEWERIAKK